jgi:hypothetical protein
MVCEAASEVVNVGGRIRLDRARDRLPDKAEPGAFAVVAPVRLRTSAFGMLAARSAAANLVGSDVQQVRVAASTAVLESSKQPLALLTS